MTKTVTHISLALLALLASAVAPTRAIGGNPRAHRSSSVLLGNGMHVDMSRTPSPLTTSLVFSGADSLRGSRHVLRQELQGFPDSDAPRGRPESDEGGPARRSALEVAAEGLFDVFGFEVGGETRPLVGRATHKLPSRLDFFFWLRDLAASFAPSDPTDHAPRPHPRSVGVVRPPVRVRQPAASRGGPARVRPRSRRRRGAGAIRRRVRRVRGVGEPSTRESFTSSRCASDSTSASEFRRVPKA